MADEVVERGRGVERQRRARSLASRTHLDRLDRSRRPSQGVSTGHAEDRRRRRGRHRHGLHRHRPRRGAAPHRRPGPRRPRQHARSAAPARADALGVAARLRLARRAARRPDASRSSTSPRPTTSTSRRRRRILAAGRHVVCEKPLAMTSAESRELVAPRRRRPAASTRSTSTSASTRSTSTLARSSPAAASATSGCVTGRYFQDWLLLDTRLELAPRAGRGRRAAGGRRHRLALAGPHDLRDRPARSCAVMADLATFVRGPPRADRPGRDLLDRAARPTRSPREIAHRGRRDHPAALRERRPRRGRHLPDQRRPQELARSTRSTARRRRSPGTRSSPTSSGSAIATGPTRSCIRNPALMGPAGRAAAAPARRPRRGLRRHLRRPLPGHLRGRRRRVARPTARRYRDLRRRPRRDARRRRHRRERPARALGRRRPRPAHAP